MKERSLYNRIKGQQLADRIDPEYYTKDLLANEDLLERFRECKLCDLVEKLKPNNIADLTSNGSFEFLRGIGFNENGGIPFIRTQNLMDGYVDDTEVIYVNHECKSMVAKSLCETGDLIVCRKGKVGAASALPEKMNGAAISENVTRFSLRAEDDGDFIAAFLNANQGRKRFLREATGVIQKWINNEKLREIRVIRLDKFAEKYIGNKVRQAERLRAWANTLNISVAAHFSGLVKNPLSPRVSWVAKKEDLDPYRINPKQYDPVVLDLIQRAKANGTRLEPLSALVGARQIAGGATPKGAQYFEKGILFARVQNVKPLRLDLSDAVYIDQLADEELARSRCAADDIILTITGYPGTASLVTEEDLPVNINQHSVRFNIKDGIESGYVCAALNSKFLKYQVDRLAIGGTRDALDYPSVGRLLIPRYEAEVEKNIGEQARCVNAAVKLSQRLTNAAKLLVEALIEGQLTEAELIAAEQALQTGNDQIDRRILSRLKADGINGQGAALFADLDELYRLLAQAEGD